MKHEAQKQAQTEEGAIALLIELQKDTNHTVAHMEADEVLCLYLRSLGYKRLVHEYKKIGKLYG